MIIKISYDIVTIQSVCSFFLTDHRRLLRFTTGSEHIPAAGYSSGYISVAFVDGDAVMGSTCALKLTLPTGCGTYEHFERSLLAVLPGGRKSFTMI